MASRFGEAARKGLGAHSRAAAARREMEDVLRQASADLTDTLGVEVALLFDQLDRPAREQSTAEIIAGVPAPRVKVDALMARLRSGSGRSVPLAEVEFGALGYPVTVRYVHEWASAESKASFEQVLVKLLEDPATGEALAKLVPNAEATSAPA